MFTGNILPFFQSSGKLLAEENSFLYIIDRGLVTVKLNNFTICIEVPSWP